MDKKVKVEIRKRICYIIYTTVFLIVSTAIWFNYRDKINMRRSVDESDILAFADKMEFKDITSSIDVNKLGKISDEEASFIPAYQFSIKNNSSSKANCLISFKGNDKANSIYNNYIKYRIKKNNEEYSDIRNLAVDGRVYVDQLNKGEESVYSIQYWIDEEVYDSVKNNYFYGKLTLTNDNYS